MSLENIKQIAAALRKAQSEIKPVVKSADNPFFKSKYADLAAIAHEIQKPLANHGLSISQLMKIDESGRQRLVTLLIHESGEYLESVALLDPVKKDPQSLGAYITYMRRYAIQAILNIATENEDDDSESSYDRGKKGVESVFPVSDDSSFDQTAVHIIPPIKPKAAVSFNVFNDFWSWTRDMKMEASHVKDVADFLFKREVPQLKPQELERLKAELMRRHLGLDAPT